MAHRLPLTRVAMLGFALAFGLAAQTPAPSPISPTPTPVSATTTPEAPAVALAHRVERLKEALEKGQADKVDAALSEVESLRRNYTSLDVMPLVDAMALWARQQGIYGRPRLGLAALDKVERWAPQDPAILSTRIVLTRQLGVQGWIWSIPDLLRLTAKRLEHPAHRWLWLVQHLGDSDSWPRCSCGVGRSRWPSAIAMSSATCGKRSCAGKAYRLRSWRSWGR